MIKLPPIEHLRDEYYIAVAPIFRNCLCDVNRLYANGETKYKKVVEYFFDNGSMDETKIKKVICGGRSDLEDVILSIGEMKVKRKSKKNPAGVRFDELQAAYNDFIKTDFGQSWASKINVKTCPYCNRAYIFTLEKSSVRPDYDHFFPKSIYPYLCVSMYNLIPSCSICNRAKGTFNPFSEPFMYPFDEEFGKDIVFSLKPKSVITDVFERKYSVFFHNMTKNGPLNKKAKNNDVRLNLSEFYNFHKDYINRIISLKRLFTDQYLISLYSTFSNMFNSFEDLKEQIFLYKLNKDDWGEVILSKLTSDIMDFLDGKHSP